MDNTPKTLKSILKVFFFMLCQMLRSPFYDIEGLASMCLDDYAHRYSRSNLKVKVGILKQIAKEHNNDTLILSSVCQSKTPTGSFLLTFIKIVVTAFLNKHDKDYLRVNYTLFIDMLEEFMLVRDELLKEKAITSYNMLIFKAANPEILVDSLPKLLKKFHTFEVTDPDYENFLKTFSSLIQMNNQIIIEFLDPRIWKSPLSCCRIDIIKNTANIYGPRMYIPEFQFSGFKYLFEEIRKQEDQVIRDEILFAAMHLS